MYNIPASALFPLSVRHAPFYCAISPKCASKAAQDEYVSYIFQNLDKSIEGARQATPTEVKLIVDENVIIISYSLLSRSLELLLKAILVERDENYFYKIGTNGNAKLDKSKTTHDLVKLINECALDLPPEEKELIILLNPLGEWGTYSIPMEEEKLVETSKNAYHFQIKLDISNYEEISRLFDKFLEILNLERLKNGKTVRQNIFRL
jgi:hypothetical protein